MEREKKWGGGRKERGEWALKKEEGVEKIREGIKRWSGREKGG